MAQTATLTGKLVDQSDKSPIVGASIQVSLPNDSSQT